MRCPQCSQQVMESAQQCQCGFVLNDAGLKVRGLTRGNQILETAYIASPTAWQQSGMNRTFEDWTRLRIANIAPVKQSGTYLDIGCANGYLLACLVAWATLKGIEITPYGLDCSAKLVELARQRLNGSSHIYVGNAWDWTPPQRFDYVRTELCYVPRHDRKQLVERLLAEVVADNGQLLISQYRRRRDDLTQGWVNQELEEYGFPVIETHSGYDGNGLELCRVVVLRSP